MKRLKRTVALVLTLAIAVSMFAAQNGAEAGYGVSGTVSEPSEGSLIQRPSEAAYDTRVSYEVVAAGRAAETEAGTQSARVRFALNNPGEQPVSFSYTVISGSTGDRHLKGDASGTVTLSRTEPEKEVTVEIAPFANDPEVYSLPNRPNDYWTGEHCFYLFCSDIQNALFVGDRASLTVPVPVESEFNFLSAYNIASGTKLIDLNHVAGGENGIYPVAAGDELKLTAEISGDIRKMLDAGVFSHIRLPQGYFIKESGEAQYITYIIKARNDIPIEASKYQTISLAETGKTSFYSGEFPQELPVDGVYLGAYNEANGIFNKLDFIFDYSGVTNPAAVSACFLDVQDRYVQHHVSFSDQVPPYVEGVQAGKSEANYGDDIPVTVVFSEPVYTGGISFKANGQTLYPMEGDDTISQTVSFLYRIGDEALNAESLPISVTDITGAVDLSGKAQVEPGSGDAYVDISFDPRHTFAYCAQPSVILDQGTNLNMSADVSIPIKQDTDLSNWLVSSMEANISTAVKARAITAEGIQDIPLTVHTDETRVTELTGSFTAPENNTGADVLYALEVYLNTGSGYKLVDTLVTLYTVRPLILVDDESDITLDYTHWPPGDSIYLNSGSDLSLGYTLNVDAAWTGPEYFQWSCSDENIALINENGVITLKKAGRVSFTLTVTNPLSEDRVLFESRTLTVLESQDAYLYVPNGIKNQDLLAGSAAKISFSSNLAARNELYGGPGTMTAYTFALYELDEGGEKKDNPLSAEVINATAQALPASYTVPAGLLTKVTAINQYGYILEISAPDLNSGNILTAQANIRIRSLPAKASLVRPETVFLTDGGVDSFTVEFGIENKTSDTEYLLTVTKNSESSPMMTAASPAHIGQLTVNIGYVDSNRLLDVYTVSLKAKNPSDAAWSYDSYCVYVYNAYAMKMLLDGFPAPGAITMDYDFEDGDILYNIHFISYRYMLGKELVRTLKIDDRAYAWSAIADRLTWQVEGDSVSLWYNDRRIGDDYNPALLPGTSLLLRGDGPGSSVVIATHTHTGMSGSMNVTLEPLNDKLFLFRVYPGVSCQMTYTNGNGQEKTVAFTGEIGVYEDSGIKSDVVFYPEGGAENVYDFTVISNGALMANQNASGSFDMYPVNTVKLPKIGYNVSLELFDEKTGEAYTDDIIIRGGVYLNGKYREETTINGNMGNADQTVSADGKGQYSLAFKPSDFTDRLLASDELRYVIEVSFADNSHLTHYIAVENDDILANKGSLLGVCLKEGIKALDSSSIQNKAVVISKTLTVEGETRPFSERIYLEEDLGDVVLDMTVMVPQYSGSYYKLYLTDSSGGLGTASNVGEFIYQYPFSDTVTLHIVCDISSMLNYYSNVITPGDTDYFYTCIKSTDLKREIKLSEQLEVLNLRNIPSMTDLSRGALFDIYDAFWEMCGSSENVSLPGDDDAMRDALEILEDFRLNTASIGLEVESTDDPLVYKGIIRFAAGSYSKDNPSGVFVGSGEETSYSFMPGFSDMKAMAKGTFMKKAKEAMYDSRNFYKSFGGGAYLECLVYYSIEEREWKISLIYGDLYMGGGGRYIYTYNGWVAFVPVTAKFQFNMTAEVGLTILNSQVKNETAYIPRLRPVFSIYGFGGVGFDYKIAGFKAGPYGFAQHEQNYLWYTDSSGLKMDGQQLKISGEVGVEFDIWLTFIKLSAKYVLADYTKSWEFNDYNSIMRKISDFNKLERGFSDRFVGSSDGRMMMLVPVEESAVFEDRTYLEAYERSWGSPASGRRMLTLFSREGLTDIWTNAYPNAAPQLSDDGEMMVYLSDMGSEDLADTSVLFAVKDEAGSFSTEGEEIDTSDYPDSSPSLSGTMEGASAVWVRSFTEIGGEAGGAATVEDVINGLAASEVMAGIYKHGEFTVARLSDNHNPDISPVTAASGDRAIAAWRSVTLGDMDNPLGFTSDYIMYSIYDGSAWSEAKCLYDGSIDAARSLNAAMLPDGTSAIVYQTAAADGASEVYCAVLDADGEVARALKLTDNMTDDINPQITTAEFPDGIKRFVIGWSAQGESGESVVQMLSVSAQGNLYSDFSLELSGGTDTAGYSDFRFTKGTERLEDLSVIWSEPEDEDKDGIYEYSVFGTRLLVSEEGAVSTSGIQKLLTLDGGRILYSLDPAVDPETGKVHFVMLLAEPGGSSTVTAAVAEYKNRLAVGEPDYEYEDILPGLEMPVLFTVKNDGIDTVTHISIELGDRTFEFEGEALASGEEKRYLIYYPVPNPVANAPYTVTARFERADTAVQTGTLKLDLPDAGIYQIDCTKETQRERGFRILLQNTAFADLKQDIHTVKLEVWDNTDFTEGTALKTLTVSGDDLDTINHSLLSLDVTLTEEDLHRLLDESGEIAEGGAWLLFRTVLTENGNTIEDADISNDMDFVMVYGLIDKKGTEVSLASFSEAAGGQTSVQIQADNNSMKTIDNGNIVVILRDEGGNVLETQQTYNPADSGSLLTIPGEESRTARVLLNRTGHTADVVFTRVSGESKLLSALNLTGVLFTFEPTVYEYNLQTHGLNQTLLTAVAENPASSVSVTRNGVPVSVSNPISMNYGTNVFTITVTTGSADTTYTLTVENIRTDEETGNDDPVIPVKPGSGNPAEYRAELTIGGVKHGDIDISVSDGRAVVSLGSLAQEIFSSNSEATLVIPEIPGVVGYTLQVPAHALAGSDTGASLTVSTSLGSIRIPAGMLTGIENCAGKTVGINIDIYDNSKLPKNIEAAVGGRPVLSLTIALDGEQIEWSNTFSPVTVSIPYTPSAEELKNPESIVVWYIDSSGGAIPVHNGRYDPVTGTVTFTVTHFSLYALVYNPVSFSDVPADAWYSRPVGFIASRGITKGTGSGKYSPGAMLTRGEFIVLMMRAYNIKPDENPMDNFADAGDTYYTSYLAAAKRLGISAGVGNNMFAPEKDITRQEMFTLLHNMLGAIDQLPDGAHEAGPGKPQSGKLLGDFEDEEQIAPWARKAMELLVERGIVKGDAGLLSPAGETTRAQMAQVLYNLLTMEVS